ncbi:MAG: CsgG/HfaB family protein [Thermodesulfobacteriota bacterium]
MNQRPFPAGRDRPFRPLDGAGPRLLAAAAGILCLTSAASGAGVVTEGDRTWAAAALREEQSLPARAAPNTVGVLYFHNRTGDAALDPLQKGLALLLVTDLSAVRGLQVVERVRLQALVEELGLGKTGLVEEGSGPRVGRLLGARWLVGGILTSPAPAAVRAEPRVLDVPQGVPTGLPGAEGELAEFFRVQKDLLFQILGFLEVRLTPSEERRLRRPCTRSLAALLDLSRAVGASDAGDYGGAAAYYESALREDPGVCLAGDALRDLRRRGLVSPRAEAGELLESLRSSTSLTDALTPKDALRRGAPAAGTRSVPVEVRIDFPQ